MLQLTCARGNQEFPGLMGTGGGDFRPQGLLLRGPYEDPAVEVGHGRAPTGKGSVPAPPWSTANLWEASFPFQPRPPGESAHRCSFDSTADPREGNVMTEDTRGP